MRCSRCKADKPADQFLRDDSRLAGLGHICRGCQSGDRKDRRRRSKARTRAASDPAVLRAAEERRVLAKALGAWDDLGPVCRG